MINHAPIEELASVDSTNAEAMRRVQAGEPGPLWILAERQDSGRGRSGRGWSSEPGNLHASLLVTLAAPQPKAYQLALVAGVAVFDAITASVHPTMPGLSLKWPNDIMIDGTKAGGILIESSLGSGRLAGPIGMHRPELVVHGHAHHGAAQGAIGTVPVHNVAVHVTGQDFVVFTV